MPALVWRASPFPAATRAHGHLPAGLRGHPRVYWRFRSAGVRRELSRSRRGGHPDRSGSLTQPCSTRFSCSALKQTRSVPHRSAPARGEVASEAPALSPGGRHDAPLLACLTRSRTLGSGSQPPTDGSPDHPSSPPFSARATSAQLTWPTHLGGMRGPAWPEGPPHSGWGLRVDPRRRQLASRTQTPSRHRTSRS